MLCAVAAVRVCPDSGVCVFVVDMSLPPATGALVIADALLHIAGPAAWLPVAGEPRTVPRDTDESVAAGVATPAECELKICRISARVK
ncbi:hypothetical protein Athai_27140 [Actinocatenispora thailandica]|uniref:Uncharacterized protein n=1 Tax=Actinocatenispora thailandica TaxID=227318 RepID=A0A7R7HWZ9_9ACTN|nr:hypothetical protein Athai_27140 [Actinocatenispora thailandica]